ncbi:flavin reductase family protein [Stappia stellulata]|uniref:flavin reductase family protein n=1 Tax=Stappia stellulata TaxID=71235 RepID=UPI000686CF6E|nr:flavin reductase family protein [Stappia stellulata]
MTQPPLPLARPSGSSPASLSAVFRNAFRGHPAGVAIVTADPGSGPVALTVSSLISVNAEPPIVAFSVSRQSGSGAALMEADTIVVHLLQFSNLDLVKTVAAPGADRFGPGMDWERLATGEPRYREVRTWFRARVLGRLPLDGATLLAAELLEGATSEDGHATTSREPLVYMDRRWHRLESGPAHLSMASAGAENAWF